jgi:hypothetical protein
MTSQALRRVLIATALAVSFTTMAGCAQMAAGVSGVAGAIAGPTPTQAHDLGTAQQSATLATQIVDTAVRTGKVPRAVLLELNALSDGLHAAVDDLEVANAAHQSLDFAAFNAALDAFNAYKTANAIPAS